MRQVAASLNASASQVAVAWVLARAGELGVSMVPLVGSRTLAQLSESLGALSLNLNGDDMARINAAVPAEAASGTRYDAYQMSHLDSEA